MTKIWIALVAALFAVAAGQPLVLKLERRLANASMEQLAAMDELRHPNLDSAVVQLPVSGTGNDYLTGGHDHLSNIQTVYDNIEKKMPCAIETHAAVNDIDHDAIYSEVFMIAESGGSTELPNGLSGYTRGYPREWVAERIYVVSWPYLTHVNLGNPPRGFNVLIDTGSSPSWVDCQTVAGSSTHPGLFDPRLSSTSSSLNCSDKRCQDIIDDSGGMCNTSSNSCGFTTYYDVGSDVLSSIPGYYLSDVVHLDIINGSLKTTSSTISIIFGCTNSRKGELTDETFDGIFGFGPGQLSLSSQIYSLGLSPRVFSHCMKISDGGGILVFGKILEPRLVYTPLLPSLDYYELNLERIDVHGQKLPIDPSVFKPSAGYKTFADSGTSLAYLADEEYDLFVNAIAAAVSPSAHRSAESGDQYCFVPSSSIDPSFPNVTLHFMGGAAMQLKPKNYLHSKDQSVYCIAWARSKQRVTILGDIILADKLIVYDTENMLLGWMDYDCTRPVHVTVNSAHALHRIWIPIGVAVLITFSVIFVP